MFFFIFIFNRLALCLPALKLLQIIVATSSSKIQKHYIPVFKKPYLYEIFG